MLTNILPEGKFIIAVICMSCVVSVSNAPSRREVERVVVDDDRFWETGNRVSDIRDDNGGSPQALPERIPFENNQDNKHWYDAAKTLFQKWGYRDEDIPEPIGSGHSSTSVQLTPEFTTILRGLVEKVPSDLERDILNILNGNRSPNSNIKNDQSESKFSQAGPLPGSNQGLPVQFPQESNYNPNKGVADVSHPVVPPPVSFHDHDLELLDKEIKQLEILYNENPGLYDEKQHKALDDEIGQIHTLIENKNVDVSSAQLQALDDEIAKIQDLTNQNSVPQSQKEETLDEVIKTLEGISHPNQFPAPFSDHDRDLEQLNKEIKQLEIMTNESPDLFDTQHRKLLDEEIGQIQALMQSHKVDVPSKQVQSLDLEIAKLHDIADKNSAPESQKQETLDEVIKTLHEISHPIPSASSYSDHEREELDQEIQKLEALVANEDHHGVMNENQKQTLSEEIQGLHNVKDITNEQLKDLDEEIRQIEELVHPTNGQPNENQMQALDQEIKELQQLSHALQGSETARYRKICEDEKGICAEPETAHEHVQQTVEHPKFSDSKHGSTDHTHSMTLSESHSGMTDETIIAEDSKAIDHLIEEMQIIFEKEENHMVQDDEVHNGQAYLHELTDLIHEIETFAMSCASETPKKHHKAAAKSEITSKNEDMIIKELQKKEGPIDETSPIEASWSKLLETNSAKKGKEGTLKPQSSSVEKHLNDVNEVIKDIASMAKLERQHNHDGKSHFQENRPDHSQPNLEDVDSQKVKTLEKVIHNLHEAVIDEESLGNFGRAENKQRLDELIHLLEDKKSSGDPSALKLDSILRDLEKDSAIEYELQGKLHRIDEETGKGRDLDDVISGLEKIKHFPVKPNHKITDGFENAVKKFEASHPNTEMSKDPHHWTSFNDEVQQLKEASRDHGPGHAPGHQINKAHDMVRPVNDHKSSHDDTKALDEEVRRLEQLVQDHLFLTHLQKESLQDEIEELENLPDERVDSRMKTAVDKEIELIEDLLNKPEAPSSHKVDDEIDRLHKLTHGNDGRGHSSDHNLPNTNLRPHESAGHTQKSKTSNKNHDSSANNNLGSAKKLSKSHEPPGNHNEGIDDVIKSLENIQNKVSGLETKNKVDAVIDTLEGKSPHSITQNDNVQHTAYFRGRRPVNIEATGENVDRIWVGKSQASNTDHLKRQGKKKVIVKSKLH